MYLTLGDHDGLAYDYHPPSDPQGYSFVCFNPLTGDKAMWHEGCGPLLTEAGHGLLTWNLRGQADSPFSPDQVHETAIVEDAIALLTHINPPRPVFVGLSVGGLYAAKVHLGATGFACRALILINTLREIGPRLNWINDALLRLAETGGLELLRDVYLPLLMNETWLSDNRPQFLGPDAYQPINRGDGAWHLLKAGCETIWDVDWQAITVPVLNITGQQDHIFCDDLVIARLLKQIQNVKALHYDNAGHMVPAETPRRLARDILDFMNGLVE